MQFLESSVLGLRSAFYQFSHPELPLTLLLFPMVHIGQPEYYQKISEALDDCDNIIFEGVKSNRVWLLTQAYKIVAKRRSLGLVSQSTGIKLNNSNINKIHGDIDKASFVEHWKTLPWGFRQLLKIGAPMYGLWQFLFATRHSLAKGHTVDSISSREVDDDEDFAFDDVLIDRRDEALCKVIENHLDEYGDRAEKTAIIWGASHMPAVVKTLSERGYRVSKSQWVQAI